MKIRVIQRRCALLLIAGLSSASSIPAMAGGFSRGEANTDILFDDARFSTESSLVYVSPDRSYSKLMGQSVDEGAYSDSFLIPNVAFGMRFNDNLSCAFTYTKPFGGAGTYSEAAQNAELVTAAANGDPLPNPTSRMKVSSDEYGGTCDIRVAAGPGRMHFIGGLFVESFSYREDTLIGGVRLKDDGELGYRAGIAYDIPEYALRVQCYTVPKCGMRVTVPSRHRISARRSAFRIRCQLSEKAPCPNPSNSTRRRVLRRDGSSTVLQHGPIGASCRNSATP